MGGGAVIAIATTIGSLIMSIVGAIVIHQINKEFDKRDAKETERDAARVENNILLIKGVSAAIALGEATACAIKEGQCNGNMDAAQKYATEVKHEIKDFMTKQGCAHLS